MWFARLEQESYCVEIIYSVTVKLDAEGFILIAILFRIQCNLNILLNKMVEGSRLLIHKKFLPYAIASSGLVKMLRMPSHNFLEFLLSFLTLFINVAICILSRIICKIICPNGIFSEKSKYSWWFLEYQVLFYILHE